MTGRYLHALLEYTSRGKHGSGAEAAALQHGRAHSYDRAFFNDAALELRGMADAGVSLEDRRKVCRAMEDGVVLDVCALADLDLCLVAAQHRAKPHARACLDLDVSDEDRGRCDVRGRENLRGLAPEVKLPS